MSRSPALTRPRRLFTSSHPAAAMPSPSSAQGRSGMCRRCSLLLSRHRYRSGFLGIGEYRSLDPYTNTPGRSSSGPSASRKGSTARPLAMESPVFTTRSGASASSDLTQDISRWRPGVRCASEMCSTRRGAAPAGSTGTSQRRRANQFRSATEPYAKAVPPSTAAVPRAWRARDRIPLWCHARAVRGPLLNARGWPGWAGGVRYRCFEPVRGALRGRAAGALADRAGWTHGSTQGPVAGRSHRLDEGP